MEATTIGRPPQTYEERLAHLAEANKVRYSKAALKRELGKRKLSFGEALSDERAQRATVMELLTATRGIGKKKAARICTKTRISQQRRIDTLWIEERRRLLEAVPAFT